MYCKKCGSVLSCSSSDCLCPVCREKAVRAKEMCTDMQPLKNDKKQSDDEEN